MFSNWELVIWQHYLHGVALILHDVAQKSIVQTEVE